MSIVYDYCGVASQMKGDDWWTAAPREPEPAIQSNNELLRLTPAGQPDWRYISRICNIDTTEAADPNPDIFAKLQNSKAAEAAVTRQMETIQFLESLQQSIPETVIYGRSPAMDALDIINQALTRVTAIPTATWRQINASRPSDRMSHGSCPTGTLPHGK